MQNKGAKNGRGKQQENQGFLAETTRVRIGKILNEFRASEEEGAFLGCSLEGSLLTTRMSENCRFYGSSTITASDILLGSMARPPAAATLYDALSDLFQKLGK